MVAHLLTTAALWVESRHLSKINNERHKQSSCEHTLARQKIPVFKKWGWVAKLVAHLLATQLSGFESKHLSKMLIVKHKLSSGQLEHTLARQKN